MNKQAAQAGHAALLRAAIFDEVVSAVLELHKPTPATHYGDYVECYGCDMGDYAEGPADWPCTTIMKINEFLRVEGIVA